MPKEKFFVRIDPKAPPHFRGSIMQLKIALLTIDPDEARAGGF